MTEFESKSLALLERIAKAVEGKAATPASTGGQRSNTPRDGAPTHFPNYGRSKGQPIAGATREDLEYYANGARRSLADPSKSRFHDKEQALLDAIEAELARGPGGGDAADDFGPPPYSNGPTAGGSFDEDIPFSPRWDVA